MPLHTTANCKNIHVFMYRLEAGSLVWERRDKQCILLGVVPVQTDKRELLSFFGSERVTKGIDVVAPVGAGRSD